MAVWTESQVVIMCDLCFGSDATSTMTRQSFVMQKRSEGWTHGKITLCPWCAKNKRNNARKDGETE